MNEIAYQQGNTKVWSDGEKLVITNNSSDSHLETNVDEIFGVGEYQEILAVNYLYEIKPNPGNIHSKKIEIISGYIPARVMADLQLDGEKKNYSEFFERK